MRTPAVTVSMSNPENDVWNAPSRRPKLTFVTTKRKQLKKEEPIKPSDFVPTRHVKELERGNFSKFLNNKQAALVMFYDPDCAMCHQSKPHFMKTAKTLSLNQEKDNDKGFASVDCTQEPGLCEMEQVENFPTFKLYVGGRFVNNYKSTPNADQMITFVEKAPEPVTSANGTPEVPFITQQKTHTHTDNDN